MGKLNILGIINASCLACMVVFLVKFVTFMWRSYQRRNWALERGCKPTKKYSQLDAPLGLGLLVRGIQDTRHLRFLEAWQQQCTALGQTFSFWLFGKSMIVTAEPENFKTILSTSFDDFELGPKRRAGFAPLFGDGIFAADGTKWSASRALLRPSFAKSQVSNTEVFETHFQNFLQVVLSEHGTVVNLHELLECLMMDTITEFLFGSSTESLINRQDAVVTRFAATVDYGLKGAFRNASLGFVGRLIPYLDRTYRRSRQHLHGTIDRYVQKALDQQQDGKTSTKYVFLEHLAQRTSDRKVLRDELISALLGGRGTTSSLLSNLLYVLARRPDIWEKLRVEVLALGAEPITQETIKNATYVRYCIHECESTHRIYIALSREQRCMLMYLMIALRIHPVVPLNMRASKKDTVLPRGGGPDGESPVFVPRETTVYLMVYAMHRRKDLFGQDADEFRPERWADLNPGWGFVPFGGGPRLCIGREWTASSRFALLLIVLIQRHLLSRKQRTP